LLIGDPIEPLVMALQPGLKHKTDSPSQLWQFMTAMLVRSQVKPLVNVPLVRAPQSTPTVLPGQAALMATLSRVARQMADSVVLRRGMMGNLSTATDRNWCYRLNQV
jgi:hypothetical protein